MRQPTDLGTLDARRHGLTAGSDGTLEHLAARLARTQITTRRCGRRVSTPASAGWSATAHFRHEQAALKVRYLLAMEKRTTRSKPTGQIPRLEVHPQGVTIDCGEGIANLNHE